MIEAVDFTAEAKADIANSYRWHERREPGLGEGFLQSLETCVQTIRQVPDGFPIAAGHVRHAVMKRFS